MMTAFMRKTTPLHECTNAVDASLPSIVGFTFHSSAHTHTHLSQMSSAPTPPSSAGGSGAFAVTPAHRHDAGQPPSPPAILVPTHDDGGVAPIGRVSMLDRSHDAEGGMLPRMVTMERQVERLQAELEEAEKTNRLREV